MVEHGVPAYDGPLGKATSKDLLPGYAWSFALTPTTRSLNRLLGFSFLQCIICMNTGWFMVFGLGIFLLLAFGIRAGAGQELVRFARENRPRWREGACTYRIEHRDRMQSSEPPPCSRPAVTAPEGRNPARGTPAWG